MTVELSVSEEKLPRALKTEGQGTRPFRVAPSDALGECGFETYESRETEVSRSIPRKEVIHPHLPVGIPCYDFTPVTSHSLVSSPPKVRLPTSGATDSHGVTGGVYKTRERIHRSVLISDY